MKQLLYVFLAAAMLGACKPPGGKPNPKQTPVEAILALKLEKIKILDSKRAMEMIRHSKTSTAKRDHSIISFDRLELLKLYSLANILNIHFVRASYLNTESDPFFANQPTTIMAIEFPDDDGTGDKSENIIYLESAQVCPPPDASTCFDMNLYWKP